MSSPTKSYPQSSPFGAFAGGYATFTGGMKFGELLQQLRDRRGLSQNLVAERARVVLNTIQRGEATKTAKCPWKRSTAIKVMRVFHRESPLTHEEETAYQAATGLGITMRVSDAVAPGGGPSADPVNMSADDEARSNDPDLLTAHSFVDNLVEERGAKNVIVALEGLAAGWSIDLRPRIRSEDIAAGTAPRLVLVHPPRQIEDREVTIYEPATPPPATPPAKAKPRAKRRTGA